jgi:hypothetical protein
MKKLSIIALMTLATVGQALAGGLNDAATDNEIDEPVAPPVGSGGGVLIGLLLLGGLAAASASNSTAAP